MLLPIFSYFQGRGMDYSRGMDYALLDDLMKTAKKVAKKILPHAKELGESAGPIIEGLAQFGKPVLEALTKVLLGDDTDKSSKKTEKSSSLTEVDSQYTDMEATEATKVSAKTGTTSKVKSG